jgi:hypothetical protein
MNKITFKLKFYKLRLQHVFFLLYLYYNLELYLMESDHQNSIKKTKDND